MFGKIKPVMTIETLKALFSFLETIQLLHNVSNSRV